MRVSIRSTRGFCFAREMRPQAKVLAIYVITRRRPPYELGGLVARLAARALRRGP